MKTSISIPDSIYAAAERLAKRLGISRSALYSKAVEGFVREHREEHLTEQIDEVCDRVGISLDPAWRAIQGASLRGDAWK